MGMVRLHETRGTWCRSSSHTFIPLMPANTAGDGGMKAGACGVSGRGPSASGAATGDALALGTAAVVTGGTAGCAAPPQPGSARAAANAATAGSGDRRRATDATTDTDETRF